MQIRHSPRYCEADESADATAREGAEEDEAKSGDLPVGDFSSEGRTAVRARPCLLNPPERRAFYFRFLSQSNSEGMDER